MRILYVAIDQTVPGTTGGSIHVSAVAQGLAALGHDVEVLTGPGATPFPAGRVVWRALRPPFDEPRLRVLRARQVLTAARRFRADAIIERYYNFGGEGLIAARRTGALGVLEVNAPIVDYPGSPKRRLDRLMIVEPMRRWRDWQCRAAGLVVTPSAAIVPAWVPRSKVVEVEWGADTDTFRPDVTGDVPFTRAADTTVAMFAGAFRPWHGAIRLVEAIERLRARGRRDVTAVLIGEGPELDRTRQAAKPIDGVTFAGAVAHDRMPACLAAADIGVAPFDVAAHPPLALDFYWSPLKIFEYMAAGLPVVAPDIPRLRRLITHEHEGLLYDAADPGALALALERLADRQVAPAAASGGRPLRTALGTAGRARVVQEFGWDVHCRILARAMEQALERP